MTTRLSELCITRRVRALLIGDGIGTVEALCDRTASSLLNLKGFGMASLDEVREELAAKGLALAGEERGAASAPVPRCSATAHDAGTGATLTCARTEHADNEYHVAGGMRWRDGQAPRGFMGGRR